jgi:hypothetical protein
VRPVFLLCSVLMVINALSRVEKGSSADGIDVRKLARAVGQSPLPLTVPQVAPLQKKTRNTGTKATLRATTKTTTKVRANTTIA